MSYVMILCIARMYHNAYVPQHVCTTTRMYHNTYVPQHVCTTTRMHHNTYIQQHVCTTTRMYHNTYAPQHVCTTTRISNNTYVPQHVYPTTRMYVPAERAKLLRGRHQRRPQVALCQEGAAPLPGGPQAIPTLQPRLPWLLRGKHPARCL